MRAGAFAMRRDIFLLAPVLLAACDGRPDPGPADGRETVHVAADGDRGVSVRLPGLDASLSLPGLDLSRHVDLDGIRLAPGTQVRTVDVNGRDGPGDGTVNIAFASTRPPAALIAYYGGAAARAGFAAARAGFAAAPAPAGTLAAVKGGRRFVLAVGPAGAGSTDTIAMTGE
jgi:hypothetical protein